MTALDLKPGSRLGPYEIVSRIGAGGMGEVFRARDTRLDRSVAIKVLPAALAENVQFRVRFEREAKTISQLNHPNICTLYDVGENYLVMELLEGESLADRLARGPLPLPEVLKYGTQIADALDKAHRQGVVHRDLKPGNIMITKSGAKLLDFGLAKSSTLDVSVDGATVHKPLTAEGTILGTFQYMSPEQLEGEEADSRTDIFALGCVLYEMVTGKRAFDGKTKTSLIAAIVGSEPQPLSSLAPMTPPALEHVVQRCLAKERSDRWQSASDVAAELRWIGESGSHAARAVPAPQRSRAHLWWLAALVLAVAATAFLASRMRRVESAPSYHFTIPSRDDDYAGNPTPHLSPDARKVAFVARRNSDGKEWLWVRRLDRFELKALMAAEPPFSEVYWSPDSRHLAGRSRGKMWRADTESGQVQILGNAPGGRAGAWASDGTILLGQLSGPLLQLSSRGGGATPVTKPDASTFERGHHSPVFLPNEQDFLFITYTRNPDKPDMPHTLYAGRLGSPEIKRVGEVTSRVQYARGHIFYVRGGSLVAVPFDEKKLEISGDPIAIADDVSFFFPTGFASFSVAGDGTVAWRQRMRGDNLIVTDPTGKTLREVLRHDDFTYAISVTADGTRVMVPRRDPALGSFDLWMYELNRSSATRVTVAASDESAPVFSQDGTRVYYGTDRRGIPDIHVKDVHGADDTVLFELPGDERPSDVSRDGKWLLYMSGGDVFAWSLGDRKSQQITRAPGTEWAARFSHDGRFVAWQSNASGREEIYAQPFPAGVPTQISTNGGWYPKWSADGHIYFLAVDERSIMRARLGGEPELVFRHANRIGNFEVLPNGRFLLISIDETVANPMRVITRWPDTLKKTD